MEKMMMAAMALILLTGGVSCTKTDNKTEAEANAVGEFYANQPVESGQYRAVNYLVKGKNTEKKGKFDGRILIALDPERSGMYVYENGNRAKIDYRIALKNGFTPSDSASFVAEDVNGRPVTITPDSTLYRLSFIANKDTVQVGFEREAMVTTTPADVWERISRELEKGK